VKAGVFVLALLALCVPARADELSDMAAAANRFYAVRAAQPRSGGLPQGVARGRLLRLFSPRLVRLVNAAAAAEARFHARVKAAPPLIEGDIFSSHFEGFQTYRVGTCSGTASAGRCGVALHYDVPGQKPLDWTDDILLVKAGGGWMVDDIAYKGAFAFGNSGLLSQTLQMVIAAAP
jgi:hypothetical protein